MGMVVLGPELLETLETLQKRFAGLPRAGRRPAPRSRVTAESSRFPTWTPSRSASSRRREVRRVLARVFDESEFLSPYGLRALSKYHDDHPLWVDLGGYARLGRLRAGRVAHRHVRRQLQLAGAGLDAGQLPGAAQPAALCPIARGDGGDRVPDGKRPHAVAGRSAPTTFGGG